MRLRDAIAKDGPIRILQEMAKECRILAEDTRDNHKSLLLIAADSIDVLADELQRGYCKMLDEMN